MTQIEFTHVERRGADTISSRWIPDAPLSGPVFRFRAPSVPGGGAKSPPRQTSSALIFRTCSSSSVIPRNSGPASSVMEFLDNSPFPAAPQTTALSGALSFLSTASCLGLINSTQPK
ncbi:unnamed protein product [Pleuronectes platessa]|uniref:Uncharacterized protein n=1 Tax=Pleuronectes platessa TaxID=8262 RepID=A0A9N7ZAA3_PLEPL|nr:unnamed protein product [Pleuronectes platessa]